MQELKLVRNNSDDIGFVHACLIPGVINLDELKEWIYFVIEHYDQTPSYFFRILDLNHKFEYNAFEIMGFVPGFEPKKDEYNALIGVGFKRGAINSNDNLTRKDAIKALERNPHIEKKFYEMFPFLKEKDGVTDL